MQTPARHADVLEVVEAYQQATQQLQELLLKEDVQDRLTELEQLIQRREQLIQGMQQSTHEWAEHDAVRTKLIAIGATDEGVELGLQRLRKSIQDKIIELGQKRQGLNAYRGYSGVGAAFIDSKK